jgi:hypothetical protein
MLRLWGHFFGFEAGSMCLESAQIDSYLNFSEDRESKNYHVVSEQKYTIRFASNPPGSSVYFQPTVHSHTIFFLPRTFRVIASAFVSFRVCSVEFVSLSKSCC